MEEEQELSKQLAENIKYLKDALEIKKKQWNRIISNRNRTTTKITKTTKGNKNKEKEQNRYASDKKHSNSN